MAAGKGAMLAASFALSLPFGVGAQTLAGTPITNVAAARDAASTTPVASNPVTLIVAERLDCTLASADGNAAPLVTGAVVAVVLTNTGNGREAFAVTASGGTDGAPRALVLDDGDGRYDPAADHVLADATTPALAPGGSVTLFVPTDAAASPAVTITARAVTGSGTPGTTFAGQGDGGGDAVVGATGAAARLTVALGAAELPPTIVETQAVLASDGSATSRIGAVVTYTIVTRFVSASPAARIVNPVPANTAYQPGSLTLDDASLADADHFAANQLTVPLGAVAAGSVHRVTFKAVIK